MDGSFLVGFDWSGFVDRPTQHIHDAPERSMPDRYRDRRTGRCDRHAATQAVGRAHRDAAYDTVAELLLDLKSEARFSQPAFAAILDQSQGVINVGHALAWKLNVDHSADALDDFSGCL